MLVQGFAAILETTVAFAFAPAAALGCSAVALGDFVAALGYSAAGLADSVVALVGSVVVLVGSAVAFGDSVVVLGDSVAAALGNFAAAVAADSVVDAVLVDTVVALVDFAVVAVLAGTAAVDSHVPSSTIVGLAQRHQVAGRGCRRAAEKKLSGHAADSLLMTESPEGEAALHCDQQLPCERRQDLLDELRYFVACLRGQLPWHLHASENATSCPEMTGLPYSACAAQEQIAAPEPSPIADLQQDFPS